MQPGRAENKRSGNVRSGYRRPARGALCAVTCSWCRLPWTTQSTCFCMKFSKSQWMKPCLLGVAQQAIVCHPEWQLGVDTLFDYKPEGASANWILLSEQSPKPCTAPGVHILITPVMWYKCHISEMWQTCVDITVLNPPDEIFTSLWALPSALRVDGISDVRFESDRDKISGLGHMVVCWYRTNFHASHFCILFICMLATKS